jgi:hypothetical protein
MFFVCSIRKKVQTDSAGILPGWVFNYASPIFLSHEGFAARCQKRTKVKVIQYHETPAELPPAITPGFCRSAPKAGHPEAALRDFNDLEKVKAEPRRNPGGGFGGILTASEKDVVFQ